MSNLPPFEEHSPPKKRKLPLSEISSMEALANWYEFLQGQKPSLRRGLSKFTSSVGAHSACISRYTRDVVQPTQLLTFEAPKTVTSSTNVDRSYAYCVLGVYLSRPRAGSVWLSSAIDEQKSPALLEFQARNKIAETAIIPLVIEAKTIDFLELHFLHALNDATTSLLNTLADALSRIWLMRRPGFIAEAVLTEGSQHPVDSAPVDILSRSNPYGLTKSEFRIVALLKSGFTAESICDQLTITPATLRSHVGRICRKTNKKSPAELIFEILTPLSR